MHEHMPSKILRTLLVSLLFATTSGDPFILSVQYFPKNIQRHTPSKLNSLMRGNQTLNLDECNAGPQINSHGSQYLDGLVPRQAVA
jgi:hypothetical protein